MDGRELEQFQTSLIESWHTVFKKGTDFDLWGQPVEAIECYQRLSLQLRQQSRLSDNMFNDEHRKIMAKIATCLDMRCKDLQLQGRMEDMSLEDLRKVDHSLKNLVIGRAGDFPVQVSGMPVSPAHSQHTPRLPSNNDVSKDSFPRLDNPDAMMEGPREDIPRKQFRFLLEEMEESGKKPFLPVSSECLEETYFFRKKPNPANVFTDDEKEDMLVEKSRGTLLPPPETVRGKTLVMIRVDKIGLKEAAQYIDPFLTVSVKDVYGADITPSQDTPLASYKEDTAVYFGCDVYIQKPLEFLPMGFAVFFEFKHYKPKKKSISTKCWAFLEKDEIKEGPVVIELYKKPACHRRKKIQLLTIKPLYLHLKLTFS